VIKNLNKITNNQLTKGQKRHTMFYWQLLIHRTLGTFSHHSTNCKMHPKTD